MRRFRKDVKPKEVRFTRLIKLLTASVGPVLTWARCQAAIDQHPLGAWVGIGQRDVSERQRGME